jgi:hypothetical protein
VGLVWCALLGTLVFTSSNPVVVNRAQVLASTVIVIGKRDPQKPGELLVNQVWLGDAPGERITVRDWPTVCPTGEIVVPLIRRGDQPFRVTQGEVPNPPLKPNQLPEAAIVQPLVYPATKEVLDQLTALVGPAQSG